MIVCNPLASFHRSLEDRLKAAAALKDALALLADAPSPLLALFPLFKTMDAEVLYRLVSDTLRFLRSAFVPTARKFVEKRLVSRLGSTVFISSPLAGGIPSSHLDVLASSDQCNQRLSFSQLRFGVLNPGRNGFSAPHSGNTLCGVFGTWAFRALIWACMRWLCLAHGSCQEQSCLQAFRTSLPIRVQVLGHLLVC